MDSYTKAVLTVIAAALVVIAYKMTLKLKISHLMPFRRPTPPIWRRECKERGPSPTVSTADAARLLPKGKLQFG